MARKRTFDTWSKADQYRVLLKCISAATDDVLEDKDILNRFKDHKLFRLAAKHNKHVRFEDFSILKSITVFGLVQNIISDEFKEA